MWLAGITLVLHRLGDASVASEGGHGRAADEGVQAVFVPRQDANRF